MVKPVLFVFICFYLSLLTITNTHADVRVISDGKLKALYISGVIDKKTSDDVERIYVSEKILPQVYLNSNGGSVVAAIKIGKILRKHKAWAQVYKKCFSSCFFIYIGAVERDNWYMKTFYNLNNSDNKSLDGIIGLHRPFVNDDNPSEIIKESDLRNIYAMIKDYFNEMNISQTTYDLMMNTPPDEIKLIKGDSINSFVPREDPIYKERQIFIMSMIYGVSTAEYRNREKLAFDCIIKTRDINCSEALKWGIPSKYVEYRRSLAEKICRKEIILNSLELAEFNSLLDDEDARFELESNRKLLNCRIQVMRGERTNYPPKL